MPASSAGVMNAWGVYLIASAALVGALSPQLSGTAEDSREGCDYRVADGMRSVVDSLRPGMAVTISFSDWSTGDPAHLSGHEISFASGNWTVIMLTKYLLPDVTLSPGVQYQLRLEGGSVRVSEPG